MRWLGVVFVVLAAAQLPPSTEWRQFRGPDGTGLVSSRRLPVTWGEGKNVKWKTAIHGRAWSSPIVLGDQVWITTATEDGYERFAVALDRDSGRIVHDLKLFHVDNPQIGHTFNSFASPTPVAEPGRVYVTFGSPGTAALDARTGKVLWQRRDLECNHFRGAGSSPILFRDLLIMHFDGSDQQYVVALDKHTGKTVWKTARSIEFRDLLPDGRIQADGDFRKAFSTPLVTMVNGQPLMLSLGAKAAYGYDPLTGRELWRIEERSNHSSATVPVVGHGLAYYPSGFSSPHLMAVRMDGRGDVTGTHVAWRVTRGVPQKPSIVLVGDLIFMVNDAGIASAVDARTGEVVWTSRVGGNYSASPISDGARVYFFSEEGKATVIEAARAFKVVAENMLDDGFMASPAVWGDALFLRTRTHLYRIEQ
jgi:outer membrane protein assembly factor BamB